MRIVILSVILMLSVVATCGILIIHPGLEYDTELDTTEPVLMEQDSEKSLYCMDLKGGPLYYYQYPDGTVRIVAFATMHININI